MTHAEVGEKYRVNVSMITKWFKDRENIVNKAKQETKNIFKRRPKTLRNRELFEKLKEKFTAASSMGKSVGFNKQKEKIGPD